MTINLVPFVKVGDFKLNTSIDNYLKFYKLEYFPDIDNIGWIRYDIDEIGISLSVDRHTKLIESISCYKECFYNNRNIIGMVLIDFMTFFNVSYTGIPDSLNFEDDNTPQLVFEFESLGLQIWTKHDKIVTVIASYENYT